MWELPFKVEYIQDKVDGIFHDVPDQIHRLLSILDTVKYTRNNIQYPCQCLIPASGKYSRQEITYTVKNRLQRIIPKPADCIENIFYQWLYKGFKNKFKRWCKLLLQKASNGIKYRLQVVLPGITDSFHCLLKKSQDIVQMLIE